MQLLSKMGPGLTDEVALVVPRVGPPAAMRSAQLRLQRLGLGDLLDFHRPHYHLTRHLPRQALLLRRFLRRLKRQPPFFPEKPQGVRFPSAPLVNDIARWKPVARSRKHADRENTQTERRQDKEYGPDKKLGQVRTRSFGKTSRGGGSETDDLPRRWSSTC